MKRKYTIKDITNTPKLIELLARELLELDQYDSKYERRIYISVYNPEDFEVVDFPSVCGCCVPDEDLIYLASIPQQTEGLLERFYEDSGEMAAALGMDWESFDDLIKKWIEEVEGGISDSYEVTYWDAIEYLQDGTNWKTLLALEDYARAYLAEECKDCYVQQSKRIYEAAVEAEEREEKEREELGKWYA